MAKNDGTAGNKGGGNKGGGNAKSGATQTNQEGRGQQGGVRNATRGGTNRKTKTK